LLRRHIKRRPQYGADTCQVARRPAAIMVVSDDRRIRSTIGVGLNWYLNQNVKWSLNYEVTSFDGGAADGGDREDEEVILTRLGLGF